MRLAGRHEAADDEIFMSFASGGQQHDNNNVRLQDGEDTSHTTVQDATAYEDPLDDVFGSAPASPTLNGLVNEDEGFVRRETQDPSDIPRLRSVHVTNGYREGLAASKAQHVQAGFDEGYSLGAELGMKAGWVLGALEGVVRALRACGAAGHGDGVEVVEAEMARAEEELGVKGLFGEEFFGEDGVWRYAVPGMEGEGEERATFAEVAGAHPLVRKWEGRAKELAGRVGLVVG